MLRRLEIEDFGLIERACVDFDDGATIFTGETGSGKTMLLGALAFALGARAGSDAVRRGAGKATVTLAFDPSDGVRERLAADGYELDAGEAATIVRETSEAGRSIVRLCGRPSTAAYVREIAAGVAEIAGQHEAQRLLLPGYHQELLDRFGGNDAARDAVAAAFARVAENERALERARTDEARAHERYDDALFAAREIDAARLVAGEEERLDERRRRLDNLQRVVEALERARGALSGDESGAIGALGDAAASLRGIADVAPSFLAMSEQAAALQSEAGELAASVAAAAESDLDPAELDAINARLELIDALKRKYGGSVEAALAHAETARAAAAEYEGRDRRIADMLARTNEARRELEAAAVKLTAARKRAASALGKRVAGELGDLALGSGRFDVAIEPLERVGSDGAERVEFQFSANAGEPLRPLARIASGGELSRMLLALIVALSKARDASTALVFDEIDAGVGGTTGTAVGARLGRLARDGQIICVTHLAQLATWADRHYVLEKRERAGVTTIGVREISGAAARENELARMLSGETHDAALKHARELLARKGAKSEGTQGAPTRGTLDAARRHGGRERRAR